MRPVLPAGSGRSSSVDLCGVVATWAGAVARGRAGPQPDGGRLSWSHPRWRQAERDGEGGGPWSADV